MSYCTKFHQQDLNTDCTKSLGPNNDCEYTTVENLKPHTAGTELLNVLQINACSFYKNYDEILLLLDDLTDRNFTVHALLICETFLNADNKALCEISGFTSKHRFRTTKKGGGVSIYVRDEIKITNEVESPFTDEVETIALEIEYKKIKYILCELYRVPNSNISKFQDSVNCLLRTLRRQKNIILGCDQNLDLLKLGTHVPTNDFYTKMLDNELLSMISKPTRITYSTSTLIDNIYLKLKARNEVNSFIITDIISDHCPCLLSLVLDGKESIDNVVVRTRKWSDRVYDLINKDLLFYDWSVLDVMTASESYENLISVITNIVDKHAPLKEMTVRKSKYLAEPWMTIKLCKLNQKCRVLCDKARILQTESAYIRYRSYRKILARIKQMEKRQHYTKLFQKIGKNSRNLWSVLNSLTKKSVNKTDVVQIKINDMIICDNHEIANVFNKHFSNAGQSVQNSIKSTAPNLNTVKKVNDTMMFMPINETEICTLVSRLKAKKSFGHDGISNEFLKKIINCIKYPLCVIFNKSLNSGIFPDQMKHAVVKPLFKSGDVELCDHYRPISLLPVISKVLEKIVYYRVVSHMEKHNILYDKQFGFRKHHSTNDAVGVFISDLLKGWDNEMTVISIFIDLKKAFNTVSHKLILKKLELLGIENAKLGWFRSYLTNRMQITKVNDETSEPCVINTGVPQGSLLGVLLFQLLINDMTQVLKHSNCLLYADDTTIYVIGRNIRFMKMKLQSNIDSISMWLCSNSLKLNVAKTKVLLFNYAGITPLIDISIEGELIENVNEFKFLGINLDSELSFESHYLNLYKKLAKTVFVVRKLSTFVPRCNLRDLYYAYFHSNLTYGLTLWGNSCKKSYLDSIYMLQKRLVRIICGKSYKDHSMPLFKQTEILTIYDQLQLDNVKLTHRIVHRLAPSPVINIFVSKYHKVNDRTKLITVPKYSKHIVRKSFLVTAPKAWSSISVEKRTLTTTKSVSKLLKKHIIAKY